MADEETLDGQIWPNREYFLKWTCVAADGKTYTGWAVQEGKSAIEILQQRMESIKKKHPGYRNFEVTEIQRI